MPKAATAPGARVSLTPLPSLADADLVRRAREGDEAAFEEIVRRYRAPLIRYSARHVGRDHAEDVTQHAFTRAALHLRDDPRPIHLRAWLYRVAHNAALNMRARKDWGHEQLSPDVDGVPQPSEIAAQRHQVREVVADLDRLPERQRTALLLSVFEGLGYDEIATRLHTSPNSVRALLSRARAHLRAAASALLPLPLLHSLGRKVSGLATATPGEGAFAAGGNLVQAKLVAIVATTALAGAATVERASSGDREGASVGAAEVTSPDAALGRSPPFSATAAVAERSDGQKTEASPQRQQSAAEPEASVAETPVEPAPEPGPPPESVPAPSQPSGGSNGEDGPGKEEPGPPPDESEPPPDGYTPPPPDGYGESSGGLSS